MIPQTGPVDASLFETEDDTLEISILWGSASLLHVAHLSPPRSFVIGEQREQHDFLIGADTLGRSAWPVVKLRGQRIAVVVPDGAACQVTSPFCETIDRAGLEHTGRLQRQGDSPDAAEFEPARHETTRVYYAGFTFIIRAVNAARSVAATSFEPPWFRSRALQASFALHALLLGLFYATPRPVATLSLDLLHAQARFIRFDARHVDKPVVRTGGGRGGQRASEAEGTLGDAAAAQLANHFGVAGPEKNPDPHLARPNRALHKQRTPTPPSGIEGILKAFRPADAPTSVFGRDEALARDAANGVGALFGAQIGNSFGFGGLGMKGTGRGGGGKGIGTVGHSAAGGIGAGYGSGAGGFHGRDSHVPNVHAGAAQVTGGLSRDVVQRIIRRHLAEISFCYEQRLQQRPDLEGRVAVKFLIAPSGSVQAAALEQSDLRDTQVEQCIVQAVQRWDFPVSDGSPVAVSYPFVLRVAN